MLERIIFQNHMGEEIESGKGGFYVNSNDLRDYTWTYEESSGRIVGFKRGIAEKSIPIIILAESDNEAVSLKNKITVLSEKDIRDMKPGKIIIGNYYMQGFLFESKKKDYLINNRYLGATLKFVSDNPCWIKEKKIAYVKREPIPNGFLDYPYDYSYDYTPNNINCVELENEEVEACDFKAVIQGPCMNPGFYIGSQNYQIMTELSSYEYIVLDSMTRTVYKVSRTGRVENIWNSLNKEYDNFAKIPTGVHIMEAYDEFSFEITLYERRSEPKWS